MSESNWQRGPVLGSKELERADNALAAGAIVRVAEFESQLEASPPGAGLTRATLLLELAGARLDAGQGDQAFAPAQEAFSDFVAARDWENAVKAARVMYLSGNHTADAAGPFGGSDHAASIAALGQGIWLAVSMPVDPELSLAMLQHLIDEVPPDADGAAVAAATAGFIAHLRCTEKDTELRLFAGRMLADVARRHSDIDEQAAFDDWVRRLELNQPDKFLVRLRNVIDVLVQDRWIIDREAIQASMPH